MNISLAFSDFPAPGHPFRIWCFLACGYLAPDGSFTRSIEDAKVFPADGFNSALEFADKHVSDFYLKNLFFSDSDLLGLDIDAKIFIKFCSTSFR